jgi:hypothetical protein
MIRRLWAGAVLITCASLLMPGTRMPSAGRRSASPSVQARRTVQAQPDFGKMPVALIPNRGQLDERVDYYIQGKDKTIYFGAEGVTFALTGASPDKNPRWVVKLDFVGANPGVRPVGTDRTGTTISYFRGEPGNWKSGLTAFSRIVYANLWPGIDLAYSGTLAELKYEFIVHPGADPSRIRLAYRGASSVLVDARGRLAVSTPSGGFEDGAPVAYQEKSGTRVNVPLAY